MKYAQKIERRILSGQCSFCSACIIAKSLKESYINLRHDNNIKEKIVDAKKILADFKKKIDPELDAYFSRVIAENRKKDKNISDAIQCARDITMSGGKRARAAFMYFGYIASGGKELQKILKTSASIELIHSFLLIHDDIIDRDGVRHGVETIHVKYSKLAKKHFKNKDADHFGNSMALIIGDMMGSFGGQILFESEFEPELIIKALHKMQEIVSCTIIGQAQDIYIENSGTASEKDILQMYENKTAKYTLEGPLQLGAILASANQDVLDCLSAYAIPAGIAFQIQDDILGVFGQIGKIGKPVGSDVKQGKYTILVAKAFERADADERAVLEGCLGNKDLTIDDLENFRKVLINTGSLDYAKRLAENSIAVAKSAIKGADIDIEARDFLLDIADYMLNREV